MNEQLALPTARRSDPQTSRDAAYALHPATAPLVDAIRHAAYLYGPCTAFELAGHVIAGHGDRWDEATIRSACARAGLTTAPGGTSPRGNAAMLYFCRTEETGRL